MPKLYHSRQHSIFSAQTIPLEKAKQYCLYDPKLLKYHWRVGANIATIIALESCQEYREKLSLEI